MSVVNATTKSPAPHVARIEGQVRGIARMLDQDRYCIDVITQIQAVKAALRRVEEEMLRDHVSHCVEEAIRSGDAEAAAAEGRRADAGARPPQRLSARRYHRSRAEDRCRASIRTSGRSTMKAIRVEKNNGPEVLGLRDVPEPQPAAGRVRIRDARGRRQSVETTIRAGQRGYGGPLPYTPGSDAAGVIDAVGADVTGVKVGDRVFTSRAFTGSYAEGAREHRRGLPAAGARDVPGRCRDRHSVGDRRRALPAPRILPDEAARARCERRRRLDRGAARAHDRRHRDRHRGTDEGAAASRSSARTTSSITTRRTTSRRCASSPASRGVDVILEMLLT